jgi:two-component system, NtrC family, sensor kinase
MQLAQMAPAETTDPEQQAARRRMIAWWALALALASGLAYLSGVPPLTRTSLAAGLALAALVALGDLLAVELEDGGTLTPAPALLLAGLAIFGWPAALEAALLGSLLPALRRPIYPALHTAGARALFVLLLAPIDRLTHAPTDQPFTTPLGLLGLVLAGLLLYTIEVAAAPGTPLPLRQRWRPRLRSIRWYGAITIALGGALALLWHTSAWALPIGLAVIGGAQYLLRGQVQLRRTTAELAELEARQRLSKERLERLQSLATTMVATRDVQQMLGILCERLAALLGAPAGWVVLLDENGAPWLKASHNIPPRNEEVDTSLDAEAYGLLLQRGHVMINADERRHELAPAAVRGESWRWSAVLSIPLATDQRALGAICLAFEQLRGLDTDEKRVLASFARQAAVTLENARLFDELRHKQAELIQSSKLAAVGTFAAGIAHEFNNLLGGMLGYSQLGRSVDDVEEKNRALDVVIQACLRGRSITRGLLTFARRQENRRELADVGEAVEETLTLVEIDIRKAQIAVIRQIEPVPPTVCDLGQIAQVVLNLVTNARDAMRPDGGTLTVSLRERRGAIELSVSDTGCGIPDSIRDRLFEPFVTTKGVDGGQTGTGLGLSVSYGIIKDHGGEIVVDSAPGRGTTMTVRLPVVPAEP